MEMISFQFMNDGSIFFCLIYSVMYQVSSVSFLIPLILLRSILEENYGWKKLINKWVHILKKPQYWFMFLVDYGIWSCYILKVLQFDSGHDILFLFQTFSSVILILEFPVGRRRNHWREYIVHNYKVFCSLLVLLLGTIYLFHYVIYLIRSLFCCTVWKKNI